ncbi:MAG TPA: hypothetical protein VGL18_06910 [Actinomycetota bacterium]
MPSASTGEDDVDVVEFGATCALRDCCVAAEAPAMLLGPATDGAYAWVASDDRPIRVEMVPMVANASAMAPAPSRTARR